MAHQLGVDMRYGVNKELIAQVGDIDVMASEDMVFVSVDDRYVLTIPRQGAGLEDLAAALTKLVK